MDNVEKLALGSELFRDIPSASVINTLASLDREGMTSGPKIRIWQNHSAAAFAKALKAFGAFHNVAIDVNDQGYDDSFMWFGFDSSDLSIVWVDVDRLGATTADSKQWFMSQLHELVRKSINPIFVVVSSQYPDSAENWSNSAREVLNESGIVWSIWDGIDPSNVSSVVDLRMVKVGGTYVAMKRSNQIARTVYSQINKLIPYAPKKLLVLDLDWTMYQGVLLEDGVSGISFSAENDELWTLVRQLFEAGVMLGIASKNELSLVEDLFELHQSSIRMTLDQFISVEAHFGSKSQSISKMIELARTTSRDTIFIDDNVGEIAQVLSELADLNVVVGNMGSATNAWLRSIPGLTADKVDENAATRVADIRARASRDEALGLTNENSGPSTEVLNQLGLEVDIRRSKSIDIDRVVDMIARTNQFNANLVRHTDKAVKDYVQLPGHAYVTASLRDKFVDSGIIFAALVANDTDSRRMKVDSLVMSCRAMGRGLEPLIVWQSLNTLVEQSGVSEIELTWERGARNQPFFDFLAESLPAEYGSTIDTNLESGHTIIPASLLSELAKVDFKVKTTVEEN